MTNPDTAPQLVNPFLSALPDQPEQEQVASKEAPSKATEIHNIPLPESVGPERLYRRDYDNGGYTLTDPARSSKSTTKVLMLLDSTLSNALNDSRGLNTVSKRSLLTAAAVTPDVLANLSSDSTNEQVDTAITYYEKNGTSGLYQEVAQAINAWINAYDFLGIDLDTIPANIRPYVDAYIRIIEDYDLAFNKKMSNRLITAAGADGVTPEDGETLVSNTNRVYTNKDGVAVSLRLTTSSHPELRLPGYSANAGFAAQAKRILGNGAKAGWSDKDLVQAKWDEALFGVLSLPRALDNEGKAHASILGLDPEMSAELAQTAKDLYNINVESSAIVNDSVIAMPDPIVVAIRRANDFGEMTAVWEKFKDSWSQEYTEMGMAHLTEINASQSEQK